MRGEALCRSRLWEHLEAEIHRVDREISRLRGQRSNLLDALATSGKGAHAVSEKLGDIDEQITQLEERRHEVQADLVGLEAEQIDEEDVRRALSEFDGVWDALVLNEKTRLLSLVIDRIVFDAAEGKTKIGFRACGIRALRNRPRI